MVKKNCILFEKNKIKAHSLNKYKQFYVKDISQSRIWINPIIYITNSECGSWAARLIIINSRF